MIPKIIHYVWVGGALPEKHQAYIETWQTSNPSYKIMCWNESNIDFSVPMIRNAYVRRKWAKVADVVRLMAVDRLGGIYFDTDFKVYKSLDRLLHDRCFLGFQHEESATDLVGNGVFGAEPGHWFVQKVLSRLLSMPARPFGFERPTSFGPKLITALLREEGLTGYSARGVTLKDIVVYPKSVFYPFNWEESFSDDCIGDMTLACHFWERSWQKGLPLPVRLMRNVKGALPRRL